ncbi:MAG: DUF2779 domain-containing protein [Deltaproteobacteria bacterium]|nr:MAG: DUF2779 domain-containing protein [Deltaproteobacteria bacterium]
MLSKSRFLAGLQCSLRLWHRCYNSELASEGTPAQHAIFSAGHQVGNLATRLHPGGILIQEDHLHHADAVQATQNAINNPRIPTIFEAAFYHDGVKVRADILERQADGRWNLIEVKSSTSVKDIHLPDLAVQYHVVRGAGVNVARAGLLHLNNHYIYDGLHLRLESLFSVHDLTDRVIGLQNEVRWRIGELQGVLEGKYPPEIYPSRHCMSPYLCEFWEHCTAYMPPFWVMKLPGITQDQLDELASTGIEDIGDIPESFPLNSFQEMIRECVINREEYVAPELETELTEVEFPVHFLDFETAGAAIPRYAGTRPYQAIPFQWSDHILLEDGTLKHSSYLCEEDVDSREDFTASLLETLGDRGTIFIYTSYEKTIIRKLAEYLPLYEQQLLATVSRFKDLHAMIRKGFYHPEFHGSFSLKAVLPALVPSSGYAQLAIQEGTLASHEYLRMVDPATSTAEKLRIKENLLAYCACDTLAMLKIREELLKRFGR